MSLCVHGFTNFFDCPECECPGCGRTQDCCVCHLSPAPVYHGAAGPVPSIEPLGAPRPDVGEVVDEDAAAAYYSALGGFLLGDRVIHRGRAGEVRWLVVLKRANGRRRALVNYGAVEQFADLEDLRLAGSMPVDQLSLLPAGGHA